MFAPRRSCGVCQSAISFYQRRIRKRATKPIRCGVDVVVIMSVIGIGVVPLTTGAPVTLGVALEVPGFVTDGIGEGTTVLGVVIIGVAV
jgi:hypothetical protein